MILLISTALWWRLNSMPHGISAVYNFSMMAGNFLRCPVSIIIAITVFYFGRVSTLGINCRGSGLCPRASWNNAAPESGIQILRDAVWDSVLPNATNYNSGDHIICVSQSQSITIGVGLDIDGVSGTFGLKGNIPEGGICLFPQGTCLHWDRFVR